MSGAPDRSPPLCVAGMHRSGTSMVTRLLHDAGLYLGEAADLAEPGLHNPDGYWENLRFVEINDDLLNQSGGGWDLVPPDVRSLARGRSAAQYHRLRARAKTLLNRFDAAPAPWGWKDPRNSLTLPFWAGLLPGLRVVVCVRNPLEVALSLHRRNDFSYAHALALWKAYNQRLLAAVPRSRRIVTHYDAFFKDAATELQRLLSFVGLQPSPDVVRAAAGTVKPELRHNRFTAADLLDARAADDVVDLYARLCREASWADPALAEPRTVRARKEGRPGKSDVPDAAAPAAQVDRRLIDAELLRRDMASLKPELDRLREAAARVTQLDQALAQTRGELARSAAEGQAVPRLRAELAARDVSIADLRQRLEYADQRAANAEALAATVESMRQALSEQAVRQVRDVVRAVVPPDATVLVVSRGDDELLRLDGRPAWHFPRAGGGAWAGHYPADSGEAIGHLESLRAAGADYLVLPETSLWWLDHYFDFRRHLEIHCTLLARVDGACRVYALRPKATRRAGAGDETAARAGDGANGTRSAAGAPSRRATYGRLVDRIRAAADEVLPEDAVVAVVSKGDEELLQLGGPRGTHFPQSDDGTYLGYHPADSAGAVTHLESLRARGVQYLLLPATAFWWLDHYAGLRDHLESRYFRTHADDACVIYRLDDDSNGDAARARARGSNGAAVRLPATETVPRVVQHPAGPPAPRRASADVIVCVHNALDDVRQCLESVVRHTTQPYSLVVVDDGSDAPARDFLAAFCADNGATLMRSEKGTGYTFAANRGLRRSKADFALLLNSDTVVTPGWLDRMAACAASDERIGLVGPLSNTASWQSVPQLSHGGDWADNPLPAGATPEQFAESVAGAAGRIYPRLPFLNGFCLMVKREVIEQVGYFDEENFGRGYGEENDYCLRARAAGWELAVADDAYVLHRQSRSYSNERRKQLCEHATAALARKHGSTVVEQGSDECRHSRVMHGVRARVRVAAEREQLSQQARSRWAGRRVLYVLPSTGPNGGCNVVLQEAAAMRTMGVDARVLNFNRNCAAFESNYPDNSVPLVYVDAEAHVPDALADYDAAIATINASVEWLQPRGMPRGRRKLVRGYYVQDFEPYFYVPGSAAYQTAWDSYARFPDLVRLTKTEWNRAMVKAQRGVDCQLVGPSVDLDLYRPRPTHRSADGDGPRVRVAAMVRPSTPRRAPRLTMEVLRDLHAQRGDEVEIVIFGCRADDPDLLGLPCDFPWRCAGVLDRRQAAWLLNETDVFADFSSFQAMGLTALEAMACGAAVIVPRAGGSDSFARHEHNALVVDTASPQSCLAALDRLVGEPILRDRLRWQAISDVCDYFPERAAYLTLEALFPGTAAGPRTGGASRGGAASGNGAAAAPGRQSPKRRRGRPGATRTPQRKRVVP